jgi:hypothetical protein
MSDCCTSTQCQTSHPKKLACPVSGTACAEVPIRTIAHHLSEPWRWQATAGRYFFCDDPGCEVVYFGDDGSRILKSQLRTEVGIKEAGGDAQACYCFGISRAEALADPGLRDYVVAQTKLGACACDVRNPSGRCCLKDFPAKPGT